MSSEFEPSSFIKQELFWLLVGREIGHGIGRTVFTVRDNPEVVIKFETKGGSFQNVIEWDTWNNVKDTDHAKWFAPCIAISASGAVLVQARTRPAYEFPSKMPAFLTDFKRTNYGMYDGRLVCHDYGTNLLIEYGKTTRMRKANWWDHD